MLNPKILKQCNGVLDIQVQDWSSTIVNQAKRWMKSAVLERLWHVDVQVSGKLHCSC